MTWLLRSVVSEEAEAEPKPEETRQVLEHMADCRWCKEDLLAMHLVVGPESPLAMELTDELRACWETQETLDQYVDEERAGTDVREGYQRVWRHLQSCRSCFESYSDLKELARLSEAAKAKVPEQQELPVWRRVGSGVYELVDAIRAGLRPAGNLFRDLPGGLVPSPIMVPRTRARGKSLPSTQELALTHEELDITIRLRLTARSAGPCRLEVIPSSTRHKELVVSVADEGGRIHLRRDTRAGSPVDCKLGSGRYRLEVSSAAATLAMNIELAEPDVGNTARSD